MRMTAATESGQLVGLGGAIAELEAVLTVLIGGFAFAVSNVLAATVISVYKAVGHDQTRPPGSTSCTPRRVSSSRSHGSGGRLLRSGSSHGPVEMAVTIGGWSYGGGCGPSCSGVVAADLVRACWCTKVTFSPARGD